MQKGIRVYYQKISLNKTKFLFHKKYNTHFLVNRGRFCPFTYLCMTKEGILIGYKTSYINGFFGLAFPLKGTQETLEISNEFFQRLTLFANRLTLTRSTFKILTKLCL